jgi:hypothetical protein
MEDKNMTMTETDVQTDLNAVNDQLTKLVEELNKVNSAREQLVTQIQNLNGVSMYLRGKLPAETGADGPELLEGSDEEGSIERTNAYPIASEG